MGAEGGPGLRSPPAMEQVQMINIQRLLEAAEYLERRERGNGGSMGALREGDGSGVRSPPSGETDPGEGIRASVCWRDGGKSPAVRGWMKDRADESSGRWWVRWKVFAEWGRLTWMWFWGGKGGIGVKVFHWAGGMVVGGSGSAETSVAK